MTKWIFAVISLCFAMGIAQGFESTANAASMSDFLVCFSPGNCDAKLVSFAKAAHSTLDIAIYDLTLANLAQAIVQIQNSGVKVRIVCDKSEAKTKTSLIGKLSEAGIPIKIGNVHGIMHNKFMIVDGRALETGSFNYSINATKNNAENHLYLNSSEVVAQFQQQFEKLWAEGIEP